MIIIGLFLSPVKQEHLGANVPPPLRHGMAQGSPFLDV